MDPSRAMGDYFTLWSTGCLFCKQNGRGMQHVLTLSSKHYSLFTPEITWHPKKIAARLISLVLPGMCYASFRENIHYLNSNSGYCEHYWRSQRTRFRKKNFWNVWTPTPSWNEGITKLRSFLNIGPFCGMWTTKTKNPKKTLISTQLLPLGTLDRNSSPLHKAEEFHKICVCNLHNR